MAALPDWYTTLPPFERSFRSGYPILTYHKLGPRPRRVRIKGLYLSTELFARQLSELSNSGFIAKEYGDVGHTVRGESPNVGITFDDGFRSAMEYSLEPLAENGFSAIQFIVADMIGKTNEWEQRDGEVRETLMDAAGIRDWLAAGHKIGSHTLTHAALTRVDRADAKREIADSKKKLEDLFAVPVEHFCYPWGDLNPIVGDMVREAGYRSACTTIPGVNMPETDPFQLRRVTARYRTWGVKPTIRAVLSELRSLLGTSAL